MSRPPRPTKEDLAAAYGKTISDVIAPCLDVLFCGINPSLYSGAVGHHFARPGNRFWPALHLGGFTDRLIAPEEERILLGYGLGVTNLVARSTATADELTAGELRLGADALEAKLARYRPALVAFLGIGAYRAGFGHKRAQVGPQPHSLSGGRVWLLPNPSGLNAHYQLPDLAREFAQLRGALRT
ncbi:MAG: G/U mismatch-specific DNA glycosylase [Actinomycetota bacterium]|nr:G/U mismatch-specific DNA glycosylase [Actinomycetota bacterium]